MSSVSISRFDKIDFLLEKWGGGHTPAQQIRLKPTEIDHLQESDVEKDVIRRLERTRALKAAFKTTYYLFNHSSSPDYLAVYLFYREFEKLRNPKRDFRHSLPFRGPNILSQSNEEIEKQRAAYPRSSLDFMPKFSVISVDAYDLSTAQAESAISYARGKKSCSFKETRYWKGVEKDFELWNFSPNKQAYFQNRFAELVDQCIPNGKESISWAILVPKDRVLEAGYFAHRWGLPCDCFKGKELAALESLQEGKLDETSLCTDHIAPKGTPPQFRLFPEKLTPENRVMTVPFGDFSPKEIEEITAKVRLFAQELFAATQS